MSEHRPQLQWSLGAAGPVLAAEDGADWRDSALCAETDPDAFFPEKGGSTREAKKVCRSCEVRTECLEYALDNDERFGIWGGLSERERSRISRSAAVVTEKACGVCGFTKPLSEFRYRNRSGIARKCKTCNLAAERESARRRYQRERAA